MVESLNPSDRERSGLFECHLGGYDAGKLAGKLSEHPENKPFQCVRTSCSAMRSWLLEYAETLRRYDGISGFSSLQTQSQGLAPMEVD